ncbi:MAG: endonuclease III [Dehalococcoidia bacterium]
MARTVRRPRRTGGKTAPRRGRRKPHLPIDEILRRLGSLYSPARAPRPYDPVSELIFTVLSQNTSDHNSSRAFSGLRQAFPTWEALIDADVERVAEAIQIGGLARIKAPRIQAILKTIRELTGSWDLSFLAEMPLAEAKRWLLELPGVGPKTAGCVLLFSLGRPAMVVDTHVYRVGKRLGLIGPKDSPDAAHDVLEAMIPDADILAAHIYLISHGRRTCKAQRPLCPECVLEDGCPSSLLRPGGRPQSKSKAG